MRILCGGEALPRKLADDLLTRAAEVWNFYGPTETTIWSTAWKVVPDATISIGKSLANTQVYILDSQLRPTPVGVPGELHIGGDGLARGYRGRPELTAEKFIANPFDDRAGSRLYKTGDWVRYLPDGAIEWVARMDQQLKIRGFRVELGEIETALRQHPGIAHAVVTARQDAHGDNRLAAYFVAKNEAPDQAELREFMRSKLPAYMVPTHFLTLSEFPLTPNGKIDTRQLPVPGESPAKARAHVAPKDDHERALVEIWQEALGLRQISVEDDVFELGADSLSTTRAFARIKRRFGIELPLRAVFENPTVTALARIVRNVTPTTKSRPKMPRRSRRVETASA